MLQPPGTARDDMEDGRDRRAHRIQPPRRPTRHRPDASDYKRDRIASGVTACRYTPIVVK
jgi:hypothetical protein